MNSVNLAISYVKVKKGEHRVVGSFGCPLKTCGHDVKRKIVIPERFYRESIFYYAFRFQKTPPPSTDICQKFSILFLEMTIENKNRVAINPAGKKLIVPGVLH